MSLVQETIDKKEAEDRKFAMERIDILMSRIKHASKAVEEAEEVLLRHQEELDLAYKNERVFIAVCIELRDNYTGCQVDFKKLVQEVSEELGK